MTRTVQLRFPGVPHGRGRLVPRARVVDSLGHVVVEPIPRPFVLDAGGSLDVDLQVNDEAGTTPLGWTWLLIPGWPGNGGSIPFELPFGDGSPLSLSSVIPVAEDDGVPVIVGPAGASVELRTTATFVQWRPVVDPPAAWINLVSLADLAVGNAAPPAWEHTQAPAATVWTIAHDLGYDPAGIVVIDDAGDMLDGFGVQYLTPGVSLRLSFDLTVAGIARLS